MSEYSYNYSAEEEEDVDSFMEDSIQLALDMVRFQPPKTLPEGAATNYTDLISEPQPAGRKREVLQISQTTKQKYVQARRGRRNDTMQLHPNFKTLARRHLRDLIYLKLLGQKQRQNCQAFLRSSPSFASLRALLLPQTETVQLRKSLLEFFSSSAAVQQIHGSRVSFSQKLLMIKYIERLRQFLITIQNGKKWKAL